MSERISIVPATFEDVSPFFNGLPPYRLRAFAGKLGDKIVGVGGLYFLPDKSRVGFLVLTEEGKKFPVTLYKATRQFLDLLQKEGVLQIRAVADPKIEAADRFLIRFGFVPLETKQGLVYRWLAPTPK